MEPIAGQPANATSGNGNDADRSSDPRGRNDAPPPTAAGKSSRERRDSRRIVVQLLALVRDLAPFLDSHGRAYCRMPGNSGQAASTWQLGSEPVLSLLSYRHFALHGLAPDRSELGQVVSLTLGELWHLRRPSTTPNAVWSATAKAVEMAVRQKGDFLGTATDALKTLQEVAKRQTTIFDTLPTSADQLGIVLNRIGLLLRESDVELFRPQRKDLKRLWAWRKLLRDRDTPDTSDTTNRQASPDPKSIDHGEMRHDDASDTFTEEEETLMELYQGVIR